MQRGAEIPSVVTAPTPVRAIFENKCADCHSNATRWPVYSRFAPVSWIVERDVRAGRAVMNLSHWHAMSADDRISVLTRIAAEARAGNMPPRAYAFMHPDRRITLQEQQALVAWTHAERKRLRANAHNQEKPQP